MNADSSNQLLIDYLLFKSQTRFHLNGEIYLPNCKTKSEKLQEQRFVQMQACILAYHKIQRNDCTAQLNNKSMHAINPFLPF